MLGTKLNVTRKQCCVWSCVCALAIALVMPPIGIFVIAPMLAQHIMYTTEIALPNSTIFPCSNMRSWMLNTADINVPFIFSATLQPYKTKVSTTVCVNGTTFHAGTTCKDPKIVELGTYMAPKMNLKAGANHLEFNVGMDMADASIITSGFLLPMFLEGSKTELIIESEHVDLVAGLKVGVDIGIKVKAVKLHNKLTCEKVRFHDFQSIPDKICHPKGHNAAIEAPSSGQGVYGRRLDDASGFEILCKPGAPKQQSLASIAV